MKLAAPITAEAIAAYQRDGAVLIKGALDAEAFALLEQGVEEAYRQPGEQVTRLNAPGGGHTQVQEYVSQRSPALRRLLGSGLPGEMAAQLMQTASAQLVLDQIFYKTAGPVVPTPWHQDTPFLRVRGDELIRLWMPCDSSPRALTVQVVRGSHRWNVVYGAMGVKTDPTAAIERVGEADSVLGDPWLPPPPDVARYRDSFDIMTWDVEPGDVLAFQGNMLHGTEGHAGHDRPRRALAVLLGGPSLRYHQPRDKAFPPPGRDVPVPHGAPIGDYPAAFPVCWPTPAA